MPSGLILAAGLGTRLRPLTDACPKPLVPVGNGTLVDPIVEAFRSAGIAPMVINAHHRKEAIVAFARNVPGLEVSVEWPDILGTAGALRHAAAALGRRDVVVWNGDVSTDIDLSELVREHTITRAAATLAVTPRPKGQGRVGLSADLRVVRLRDSSVEEEASGADFAAISVIGSALCDACPERGCLVGDVYIPAMKAGRQLRAFPLRGTFVDIGSLATYHAANMQWLAARGLASLVAQGAVVSGGVALVDTIVGHRAEVVGEGALTRVVVWPRARARAPLTDVIVTPEGVVPVFRMQPEAGGPPSAPAPSHD